MDKAIEKVEKLDINMRFLEAADQIIYKEKIGTKAKFAQDMGVSSQYFSDLKGGKSHVNGHMLKKISSKYPYIDVLYIITGERIQKVSKVDDSLIELYEKKIEQLQEMEVFLQKQIKELREHNEYIWSLVPNAEKKKHKGG
ncbi:hypothetical protein BKI52_02535 [marine bacterium AO1-C]|nr:hypothetical protein BKI52_02535 [marine bacterium AO1-C]